MTIPYGHLYYGDLVFHRNPAQLSHNVLPARIVGLVTL